MLLRRRPPARKFARDHGPERRPRKDKEREARDDDRTSRRREKKVAEAASHYGTDDLPALVNRLEQEMRDAAKNLDFETAARLRDELFDIRARMDVTRHEPRRGHGKR